jgi:hypothetical protein
MESALQAALEHLNNKYLSALAPVKINLKKDFITFQEKRPK